MRVKAALQAATFFLAAVFFAQPLCAEVPSKVLRLKTQFVIRDAVWRRSDMREMKNYLDFLKAQGYTGIDLEMMDRQKSYFFQSRLMEKMRWTSQTNLLAFFLKEWHDKNRFSDGDKIQLSLNLTPLALFQNQSGSLFFEFFRRPSDTRLGRFFTELSASYLFDALTGEPFLADPQENLARSAHKMQRTSNLVTVTPSWDYFLQNSDPRRHPTGNYFDRLVTEDQYLYPSAPEVTGLFPTIGLGDFAFALGRGLKKEVWAGVLIGEGKISPHNLLLYRTAQYKPEGFYLAPSDIHLEYFDVRKFNFQDWKEDVSEFYGISETPLHKPLANLVVAGIGSSGAEPLTAQWIEPVMNALLSNGYDVVASLESFEPRADVYYVVLWGKEPSPSFNKALLKLLDFKKSRFYGKVVVHPLGELKNSGVGRKLRQFFHVPTTEKGWVTGLPPTVTVGGKRYFWRGNVPSSTMGMSFIRESAVRAADGDVILSEVYRNITLALMMRSGNHTLVNGNYLHLEAAFFLSHLFNHALQTPVFAYVTSNRARTAILAAADVNFKIKIPSAEMSGRWRKVVFDVFGQRIEDQDLEPREIFEDKLKLGELLILETPTTAAPAPKPQTPAEPEPSGAEPAISTPTAVPLKSPFPKR